MTLPPLPEEQLITDADALAAYRSDEATAGDLPLAVALVQSADDVSKVMRWASHERVPVIPRGAGSGLSGGVVPVGDALILSLEKLNSHLEIHAGSMTATADAGVITGDIRRAAEAQNLLYAPIPASVDFCTIGGNVATNAGGLCAVKYGVTREHVMSLQAVLPTGEIIHTGGEFLKNTTGYNLTQLICGSEGTLAVVTRVTLRLLPLPPERRTMLVPFDSLEQMSDAVLRVLEGPVIPPTMEFLPQEAVDCVLGRHPDYSYPFADKIASLLIEVDGSSEDEVMDDLTAIAEKVKACGAGEPVVAATEAQRESLWTIRKQCRDSIATSGEYVEADSVVPRHRLPQLLAAAHENAKSAGLRVISYGHAGDGNLHTYFLRGDLDDDAWEAASHAALNGFFAETKRLEGTLSGEHGIGLLKRDYMPVALAPHEIDLMRRIKTAFDPQRILNPHKVLPAPSGGLER